VKEYPNPQSDYHTKGISLNTDNDLVREILADRDEFIQLLLELYQQNMLISEQSINAFAPDHTWNLELWCSIMETENVLNALPGRPGQYSLFRTHHTVNLVAGDRRGHRAGLIIQPLAAFYRSDIMQTCIGAGGLTVQPAW
jgi:hypothetical protein